MGTPLSRPMPPHSPHLPFSGPGSAKASHGALSALLHTRPAPRHLLYAAAALFATWTLFSFWVRSDADAARGPYNDAAAPVAVFDNTTWPGRAEAVKAAFVHAYRGWERWAAPRDELLPLSETAQDNFNGWGVTMFDSLDTMLLMGLTDDFKRALPRVAAMTWPMKPDELAPFFETIIRYLGGLLSAYALSREPILLHKADELGTLMSPAFESPSGFPVFGANTKTGRAKGSQVGQLAEIGTLQLEYLYLAKETGRKAHFDRANRVIQNFANTNLSQTGGMLPSLWNLTSGVPLAHGPGVDILSLGAAADSTHEYLLKQALLTGKKDRKSIEMYLQMTTEVIAELLYIEPSRGLMYVTDVSGPHRRPSHTYEHLSTFAAGLFALGAHTLPLDTLPPSLSLQTLSASFPPRTQATAALLARQPSLAAVHKAVAAGLAETAWLGYADSRSGLGPEEMSFAPQREPRPWAGTPLPGADDDTVIHGPPPTTITIDKHARAPVDGAEPRLWADALREWDSEGRKGNVPGTGEKAPVVYSAEDALAVPGKRRHERGYFAKKQEFLLRPESIESFYLMWKTTGDPRWRERGWTVFCAIERYARTRAGYAALRVADYVPPPQMDDQPSFFLAETLKYLYLLFVEEEGKGIDLGKWVFNTEAHPLPVFEWTEEERRRFGVPY